MKIIDIYNKAEVPVFSVEVLPPRNGGDEQRIFALIEDLSPFDIGFISITMGSDLSLRGGSLALAALIKSRFTIDVLAHCTSVHRSKEEIENLLTEYRYLGLENILALRGDPPIGEDKFIPHPLGHSYASEMIEQVVQMNQGHYLVRKNDKGYKEELGRGYYRQGIKSGFCIGVAGHPDGHPDCSRFEDNFVHLKQKQDNGAEFIITQAFFDINIFERFLEKAHQYGITIPIIPGVMPVINARNLDMVKTLFQVDIPKKLLNRFDECKNDPEGFRKTGIDYATTLCAELVALQVKGIQLFSLNRRGVVTEILSRVGKG